MENEQKPGNAGKKENKADMVCISVKVATIFRSKLATPKESIAF